MYGIAYIGSSTCTWLVGAVSRTIRADRYLNMTVMDVM